MTVNFWSEVFFTSLISFASGWSILDCPLSTKDLLEIAASSNWLKAAKLKDKEFIKNSGDLTVLAPSYVLDRLFGIDFLIEVELPDGPMYFSVDVTSNCDINNLEKKVYTSRSQSRRHIATRLGLDGHLVVAIDEKFEHFSLLSHWEKVGIISAIEKALVNQFPYVRLTKE